MIYLKTIPQGIDVVINDIQKAVASSLSWNGYNAYLRVYKNETENGLIPEFYKDITQAKVGDYEEVYLNDNLNASSFFYTSDNIQSSEDGRMFQTSLSMVFQVDLAAVTNIQDSRNDEEVHGQVIRAINSSINGKVNSLITGIKNVYSEFDTSKVKWDDMQPFHVFRVDIDVNYEYSCKTITQPIIVIYGQSVVMI